MQTKRVRISNESLNSYGTRVLTSGLDIEQYLRNPVLLYQHERGKVIGIVKDMRKEGSEVTGELEFDCATDLSVQCKKQYEFGSLRMVSVGIDIVEISDSKEHLVQGQTRGTITKSKLFEVSLVDIGANDDALVLTREGKQITLGYGGDNDLPKLSTNKNNMEMEQKNLALELGLPETADEAAIMAAVEQLKLAKDEVDTLRSEKEQLLNSAITTAVEGAISERRIGEEKKEQFVSLGKKVGLQELQNILSAIPQQVKLSQVLSHQGRAATVGASQLSDLSSEQIAKLRAEQPEEYKRLYKAEYGMECEIE